MKKVIILLAIIGMCIYSYAEEYTYESVDGLPNVGKIISTETNVVVKTDNVTIESLRAEIAGIREAMAQSLTNYNEGIGRSKARIAVLRAHIAKLNELNIVALDADVIPE